MVAVVVGRAGPPAASSVGRTGSGVRDTRINSQQGTEAQRECRYYIGA